MIVLALALNTMGFLILAVVDPRHCEALVGQGRRIHRRKPVNITAAALIGLSFLTLLLGTDAGTALVVFTGVSTVGSALTVLAIVLRRQRKATR